MKLNTAQRQTIIWRFSSAVMSLKSSAETPASVTHHNNRRIFVAVSIKWKPKTILMTTYVCPKSLSFASFWYIWNHFYFAWFSWYKWEKLDNIAMVVRWCLQGLRLLVCDKVLLIFWLLHILLVSVHISPESATTVWLSCMWTYTLFCVSFKTNSHKRFDFCPINCRNNWN